MSSRISCALSAVVILSLAVIPGLSAQAPAAFEVASIRPTPDGPPTAPGGVQFTQHQFRASYLSLRDYIAIAYRLPLHQISAPDWVASRRFEIAATFPDGTTPEQFPRMLQALLVERFQLQTHRESRESPVYVLEVAAGGFKLPAAPEDVAKDAPFIVASSGGPNGITAELGGGASLTFANGRFEAKKVAMMVFAETLSRFVDRPVLNLTRLDGRFDIRFDVTQEEYAAMLIRSAVNAGIALPPEALDRLDGASIGSVQDALKPMGLSLKARREPLEILVVDSINRTPTEN